MITESVATDPIASWTGPNMISFAGGRWVRRESCQVLRSTQAVQSPKDTHIHPYNVLFASFDFPDCLFVAYVETSTIVRVV